MSPGDARYTRGCKGRNEMDKSGFSSFLLGLGVGIGIGMLFAPKSGADTRQLIKDKTGEGADFIKQQGTDLRDSASTTAISARAGPSSRTSSLPRAASHQACVAAASASAMTIQTMDFRKREGRRATDYFSSAEFFWSRWPTVFSR